MFFFSLRPNCSSHRGHNPPDGGGRLLLPLRLVHQRHAEVAEAERHALQDGLTRVGPVFWKLCENRVEKGLKKQNIMLTMCLLTEFRKPVISDVGDRCHPTPV